MDWTRKETVELYGFKFEIREMSLAVQKEIDAAVKAGGSVVDETLKRCVYVDGHPLGDQVGNVGYSIALPLVEKIQSLANFNPDLVAKATQSLGEAAVAIDQGRPVDPLHDPGRDQARGPTGQPTNGTGAPVPKL